MGIGEYRSWAQIMTPDLELIACLGEKPLGTATPLKGDSCCLRLKVLVSRHSRVSSNRIAAFVPVPPIISVSLKTPLAKAHNYPFFSAKPIFPTATPLFPRASLKHPA